MRGDQLIVLIVVPITVIILTFLLQRTTFGLAVRSSADNQNAAALAGIRVRSVSTQVWIIAGVLSAISGLLAPSILGYSAGNITESFGPGLLLPTLTAALVGGMTSFPLAMAGGVAVGVIETVVLANEDKGTGHAGDVHPPAAARARAGAGGVHRRLRVDPDATRPGRP